MDTMTRRSFGRDYESRGRRSWSRSDRVRPDHPHHSYDMSRRPRMTSRGRSPGEERSKSLSPLSAQNGAKSTLVNASIKRLSRGSSGPDNAPSAATTTTETLDMPSSVSCSTKRSSCSSVRPSTQSRRRSSFSDFEPKVLKHKLRPKSKLRKKTKDLDACKGIEVVNLSEVSEEGEGDEEKEYEHRATTRQDDERNEGHGSDYHNNDTDINLVTDVSYFDHEVILNMAQNYVGGGLDMKSAKTIIGTLVDLTGSERVAWDDVCGLQDIKDTIEVDVILPWENPDYFKGLRAASKGILLYGPPGSGKTLIGKCLASQMKARFFNITASSLITKWAGEAERAVKTLFQIARAVQPTIIFIDEIDALLSNRSENEKQWERRVKTEFLTELDGCQSNSRDRVLFLGATNIPQSIDPAFVRRFATRLYVPLPKVDDREVMIKRIMSDTDHSLSKGDIQLIALETEGYSGSDLRTLCKWAAKNFLRNVPRSLAGKVLLPEIVPPVVLDDFQKGLKVVKRTVSQEVLDQLTAYHAAQR
ncbi:Fidgetin-like protein 1 [Frankliniella fusca]|uniref:Fidgetin-like protein 1 n=1 Tax=Frankliniella fusca TaxID=407009 RepID=A0AAE1H1K2_9NEOP|nr:Fidgetin-like protein 1 [Frankliniella fusca]